MKLEILGPKQQVIDSVTAWFEAAPPKKGAAHWVDGRSAKELAKAWFRSGEAAVPQELAHLLLSSSVCSGASVTLALPEHKTHFDGHPGGPRHHDVLALGRNGRELIVIGVEAKAGETLGERTLDRLEAANEAAARGESTNVPDRVDSLLRGLFGRSLEGDPSLGQLRYQLLTAAAGTLVEATKRQATSALLVIHDFSPVSDAGFSETELDVSAFVSAFSRDDQLYTANGVLHGPLKVAGGGHWSASVPLYVSIIRPAPQR